MLGTKSSYTCDAMVRFDLGCVIRRVHCLRTALFPFIHMVRAATHKLTQKSIRWANTKVARRVQNISPVSRDILALFITIFNERNRGSDQRSQMRSDERRTSIAEETILCCRRCRTRFSHSTMENVKPTIELVCVLCSYVVCLLHAAASHSMCVQYFPVFMLKSRPTFLRLALCIVCSFVLHFTLQYYSLPIITPLWSTFSHTCERTRLLLLLRLVYTLPHPAHSVQMRNTGTECSWQLDRCM